MSNLRRKRETELKLTMKENTKINIIFMYMLRISYQQTIQIKINKIVNEYQTNIDFITIKCIINSRI